MRKVWGFSFCFVVCAACESCVGLRVLCREEEKGRGGEGEGEDRGEEEQEGRRERR